MGGVYSLFLKLCMASSKTASVGPRLGSTPAEASTSRIRLTSTKDGAAAEAAPVVSAGVASRPVTWPVSAATSGPPRAPAASPASSLGRYSSLSKVGPPGALKWAMSWTCEAGLAVGTSPKPRTVKPLVAVADWPRATVGMLLAPTRTTATSWRLPSAGESTSAGSAPYFFWSETHG